MMLIRSQFVHVEFHHLLGCGHHCLWFEKGGGGTCEGVELQWAWLGAIKFLPFCCALESCLGLSRVVLFLELSPVVGLTRGRVAIPLVWTLWPLIWPLVREGGWPLCWTPLAAPAMLVTLPLDTMLPLIDMLSQLSPLVCPLVVVTPLNNVPGPPISLDLRGGKC